MCERHSDRAGAEAADAEESLSREAELKEHVRRHAAFRIQRAFTVYLKMLGRTGLGVSRTASSNSYLVVPSHVNTQCMTR